MKVRYLAALTKGTLTSSTLPINPEWYIAFKLYVKGVFYERLVAEKIFETGAVTTIPTYTPAQLAYQMAQSYMEDADKQAESQSNEHATEKDRNDDVTNGVAPRIHPEAARNGKERKG